jgi:lipoate-protein ligase A
MVPRLARFVTPAAFQLTTFRGSAGEFHTRDLLADGRPAVVVCEPTAPAVVLGSRQQVDVVDVDACRRAGVDIVKRRSGGGVVLVEPAAMCWFDVVAPAGDPRMAAAAGDVGASMRWLGARIVAALAQLSVADATAHAGPMTGGGLGQRICFAGLGPGEVLLHGNKLVGISQRRTRGGSRFQCMVHLRWEPDALVSLLAPPRPAVAELPPVAVLPAAVATALPDVLAALLVG